MSEQDRFGSIRLSPETIKAREKYAKERLGRTAEQVAQEIRSERRARRERQLLQECDQLCRGIKRGISFWVGAGSR